VTTFLSPAPVLGGYVQWIGRIEKVQFSGTTHVRRRTDPSSDAKTTLASASQQGHP
jgi:hypothetical protein